MKLIFQYIKRLTAKRRSSSGMSFRDCLAHWVALSLTRSIARSRHASPKSKSTPSFYCDCYYFISLLEYFSQSLDFDQFEVDCFTNWRKEGEKLK